MQSPQPSIVTPAPSPAPCCDRSLVYHRPNHYTAQPPSAVQPPINTQQTASTSGPPSRRLRST
eukprot:1773817-Pleurochrysis_carterae.AAC.1